MKKVVLAGGSGNLGKLLTASFLSQGYELLILSREARGSSNPQLRYVQWDGEHSGPWTECLASADLLINLSGASINTRFTEKNKKLLLDSRLQPTRALGEAIATLAEPPKLWVNLSGIARFGGVPGIHTEDSTRYGQDFLAMLTQEWEAEFEAHSRSTTKQVLLRMSPVLSPQSGMFAELYPLVKYGLGGKVGSGEQLISWIHEADFVALVNWVSQLADPSPLYHACSPNPVSNSQFMEAFRTALGSPIGLPLPTFLARLGSLLKGVDSSLLLQHIGVSTKRTIEQGYAFKFPTIELALKNLIQSS